MIKVNLPLIACRGIPGRCAHAVCEAGELERRAYGQQSADTRSSQQDWSIMGWCSSRRTCAMQSRSRWTPASPSHAGSIDNHCTGQVTLTQITSKIQKPCPRHQPHVRHGHERRARLDFRVLVGRAHRVVRPVDPLLQKGRR